MPHVDGSSTDGTTRRCSRVSVTANRVNVSDSLPQPYPCSDQDTAGLVWEFGLYVQFCESMISTCGQIVHVQGGRVGKTMTVIN